jgi:hypothetical protein
LFFYFCPGFYCALTGLTATLILVSHVPLTALHQNLFGTIDSTRFAVPFFIYAEN